MNAEYTKIFVKDLEVLMYIGVHEHEKGARQPVIVNAELTVKKAPDWEADELQTTISYEDIADWIRHIAAQGHINLVETFAEKIATRCLAGRGVLSAAIRIEKPAILKNTKSAGVEIFRTKNAHGD